MPRYVVQSARPRGVPSREEMEGNLWPVPGVHPFWLQRRNGGVFHWVPRTNEQRAAEISGVSLLPKVWVSHALIATEETICVEGVAFYFRVCHILKLWTQALASSSCSWDRRMNFKPEFKIVLLRLILVSENLDGIHLIKCKQLQMTQSPLAPLVFEEDLADIISWHRANSCPLKKISKIDKTSMCRIQPRLIVRGAEGDEFR